MIKVDSIEAEYCLPCADELDIETKRGKRVRGLFILAGIATSIWWLITGFWWTEGGICIGTMAECLAGGL